MMPRRVRIGIDVGGTFTDGTLIDGATGRICSAKAFTTPADRSQGVIEAIETVIAEAGLARESVRDIVHGSTTGTNALASRMHVAAPSVTNMVKRLAQLELVVHSPYRGIELTPAGRAIALEVVVRAANLAKDTSRTGPP